MNSHVTEYKFLRQDDSKKVPTIRYSTAILLAVFQALFIFLFGFYAKYNTSKEAHGAIAREYPMFMDVHAMMFVGFGFLMTFLKRYGYSSIGFNFIIAAFVLEWALLVRGFEAMYNETRNDMMGQFTITVPNLLVADFCSAAVLISFGAVLGKASLSQLIIMAFVEVILQSFNEHIGLHCLKAVDIGESMYVHVFGAYFGLAVSKVLSWRRTPESSKEGSNYHSDLFSMIGTIFLFIFWPSFNSAAAFEEGQTRAIVNTYLSITASCITVFIFSVLVGKGKMNMVHIQNATLAGGVAIGAVADLCIQPYGALLVGSLAGIISVLGYQYLTPVLNHFVHDTCGVNNLHGMPGVISGIVGGLVAWCATSETYGGDQRLDKFYPRLFNSTELGRNQTEIFHPARSTASQGGYQMAALGITLLIAIVGGLLTGLLMRLPIFEQVKSEEELFDDLPTFITPEDYSVKLTEIRVGDDLEMSETVKA